MADGDNNRELTELRRQNRQLERDVERLVQNDQLTGLMIRSAFINKIDACLNDSRGQNIQSALIEIGLRDLPQITGALGRHVGDYVISALASRLNQMVEGDRFCSRLDYWSFAVFIPKLTDALEALTFAKAIISSLGEPIDWLDRKLFVEAGAGVSLASTTDRDAATMLIQSGLALKTTFERGGPGYSFFNPALALAAKRKQEVLSAVHTAIEEQQFTLAFQPYFHTLSGELAGFEALLRLHSPTMGHISPVEFIPVAEESGLIGKIGAWVVAEACRVASAWPKDLMVAVNFSARHFMEGSLLTDVHNAIELWSFPPYRLEIEITESTMLGDTDFIMSQLSALRELGCNIVMDDFGTGYSSLSYLMKFPFSKLKIDRAFVQAIDGEPKMRGMLQSIIEMSRHLGLKTTAEGMETEEHMMALRAYRCDFVQGYLTGRPVSEVDVAGFILSRFAKTLKDAATLEVEMPPAATGTHSRFEF